MPAELFFSNSAGLLLDRLAESVAQGDPMTAPRIATPTPAMRRMVQMGLAERLGAVANLDFLQLESALWESLARLDAFRQAEDRKPARILDPASFQSLLLTQLLTHPPKAAADYLHLESSDHRQSPLGLKKATQLAARLANLFREYEYSRVKEHGRESLAALWLQGKPWFETYSDSTMPEAKRKRIRQLEAWQGALYRDVFGVGGLRDRIGLATGQYLYTLPQYGEMVLRQSRSAPIQSEPVPDLYLFGLAHVSPFHRSLIRWLSEAEATAGRPVHFHIFALNPCAEYWEDATDNRPNPRRMQQSLLREEKFAGWRSLTEAEKNRTRVNDSMLWAEALDAIENDNALLSRWGQVGRENIQLWCQIADYDFAGHFRPYGSRSLLGRIQDSVLNRLGPLDESDRLAQDSSLRVVAASEKHVELEAIQSDMLDRMARDKGLRPDDMAILLVQPDEYGPVVDRVFGARLPQEPGAIPFTRPEASAAASDLLVTGLLDLVGMAESGWERKQLLSLLANPRCLAKMELEETDAAVIRETVSALNLYQGSVSFQNQTPGDTKVRDPQHFSAGLWRLLLGRWMEPPGEWDDLDFAGAIPHAVSRLEDEALGQWIAWMEAVESALIPFHSGTPGTLAQWSEAFLRLAGVTLQPDSEMPAEMSRWRALNRTHKDWEFLDRCLATAQSKPEELLPKDLYLAGLRQSLTEPLVTGASWLSGGVQIGTLDALRGVPFRVIYVPGLQEGDFPDESLKSSLDLRQFRRVIGDLEPSSRNRYALLMAIMQARDAVCLSFVDKDLEQNQDKQPSSAITEWMDILERDFLKRPGGKRSTFQWTPVAAATASSRSSSRSHSVSPIGSQGSAHPLSTLSRLDMDELVRFLRHPREQWLQWNLGLDRHWDEEDEEVESYTLDNRIQSRVAWESLAAAARSGTVTDFSSLAERQLRALQKRGGLPPGPFGEEAFAESLAKLKAWYENLENGLHEHWGQAGPRALMGLRLGDAWPKHPELPRRDWPAVKVDTLSLQGYLGFALDTREGGLGFVLPRMSPSIWGGLLPYYVFCMAALLDDSALADRISHAPVNLWVRDYKPKAKKEPHFRLHLNREQARAWWDSLLEQWKRLPQATWPPALDLWGDMVRPGQAEWPWQQGLEKRRAFEETIRQREAYRSLQPEPGHSVLQEVRQLLPHETSDRALVWVETLFQTLMVATEVVKAPGKKE